MIKAILIEDNFNQDPQRNGELKPILDYSLVEIIDDPTDINDDYIIYEVTNAITKKFCWYEVHIFAPKLPWGTKRKPKEKYVFSDLQLAQNFVEKKLKSTV